LSANLSPFQPDFSSLKDSENVFEPTDSPVDGVNFGVDFFGNSFSVQGAAFKYGFHTLMDGQLDSEVGNISGIGFFDQGSVMGKGDTKSGGWMKSAEVRFPVEESEVTGVAIGFGALNEPGRAGEVMPEGGAEWFLIGAIGSADMRNV
jgi:hypothetical protein